jgi:hypothetical protein
LTFPVARSPEPNAGVAEISEGSSSLNAQDNATDRVATAAIVGCHVDGKLKIEKEGRRKV